MTKAGIASGLCYELIQVASGLSPDVLELTASL
jgi:hypothetical protein